MSNVYHILFQFYQKTLLKLDFSQENVYYINEKLENLEKIMAFTTGERYRAYADWTPEYIEKIKKNTESSPWRTNFHIETPHGLLNDPNGFSYFNGKWTLFTNTSHSVLRTD